MTAASDETQRVRDYLKSQANKLSLAELVEKIRRDTAPLWQVAATVPVERLSERPAPEDWSAVEVLTHVLDMTERGSDAIESIIANGVVPPPIHDELRRDQRSDLRTVADYQRVWSERREQLYARVLAARGDEHLDVPITHSTFGRLSWREWLLFMRVHDLDHMRQLHALTQHFAV
jgi:hypothetical protein